MPGITDLDVAESAIVAAVMSDGSQPMTSTRRFPVMGTHASITVVGGHSSLVDDAVGLAVELDGLWSRFSPDSDISLLNLAEGRPVEVDSRTVELVEAMMRGYRDTRGAFDPTLLPFLMAQGYSHSLVDPSRATVLPSSARAPGNLDGIRIEGDTVTVPLGTTLDSGGIGKGLAADLIVDFLRSNGALGAMVELGGDIRVDGASPRGRGWRLGIEHPFEEGHHISVVEIQSGGLATSSLLKRRFVSGSGDEGHHLIDSQTGKSLKSTAVTVSVLAPTAAQAEVFTKVGFSKPSSEFILSAKRRSLKAGLVTEEGQWVRSSDWPEYRA